MFKSDLGRRGRRARYLTITAALVGSALAPVSAVGSAPVGGQPIEPGENLTIVHNIDFVAAFGVGAIGDDVTVEVLRNGVVIGSGAGPLVDTAEGPGLEVNHGPLGAPVAGDCWTDFTPDLIPGDLIRVTHEGGDVDEALVDHLSFDSAEIEPGTGDVLYKGEARYANDGSPIPAAELNSGFWRTTVDGQDVRGEGPSVTNPAGDYTARWLAPNFGVFKPGTSFPGLTAEHVRDAERAEFGYGHVAPLPPETQLADGIGETPGPALGCEASPSESNAVLDADDQAININSGTLELTGSKMTDADSVEVTLTNGATTVGPLPVAPGAGPNDWVLSVSRAQLDALAQGEITISGAYDHGGTLIGGRTLSIQKDTVAPDVSPSLAPGTYTGARSVELLAGPGETIRFGTAGVANRDYEGAIDLPVGNTTITAQATDAAGNTSAVESYAYTINAPANGGGGNGGAGAGGGAIGGGAGSPVVLPAVQRFVQVSSLRTRSRVRLRSARRSGIRVSFVAPEGADVVRVQLFRGSRAAQADQPLGQATVQLRRSGRHAVRLRSRALRKALRRGVYRIVISAGQSEDSLNLAVGKRIRIVR